MLVRRTARVLGGLAALTVALSACGPETELTAAERAALRTLGPLGNLPDAPSNQYADDPAAISFGHALFWEPRLSRNNALPCVICHQPSQGWSINEARSLGSSGPGGPDGTTQPSLSRWHSPTLHNVGYQPLQFWDGRGDSLWMQARVLVSPRVHRLTEPLLAHRIAQSHAAEYEALFGPLPDLSAIPEDAEFEALSPAQQTELTWVLVNVGKALEAYQRQIVSSDSALDRWIAGDDSALDAAQIRGAKLFVDPARGCIECHGGPNLTDNWFHNVGVEQAADAGTDTGAYDGLALLVASPFNAASAWADDPGPGQARIAELAALLDSPARQALIGAFKTPSLRSVVQRPRYGHTGETATLEGWIVRYYSEGGAPAGYPGVSEVAPRDYTEAEVADLVAFLTALEGTNDLGPLAQSP